MHSQGKGDSMIPVSTVLGDLFSEILRQLSTDFYIILVVKNNILGHRRRRLTFAFSILLMLPCRSLFIACSLVILLS